MKNKLLIFITVLTVMLMFSSCDENAQFNTETYSYTDILEAVDDTVSNDIVENDVNSTSLKPDVAEEAVEESLSNELNIQNQILKIEPSILPDFTDEVTADNEPITENDQSVNEQDYTDVQDNNSILQVIPAIPVITVEKEPEYTPTPEQTVNTVTNNIHENNYKTSAQASTVSQQPEAISENLAVAQTSQQYQPDIPENTDVIADISNCNYVLNTNSKKIHYPSCSSVKSMALHNTEYFIGTREQAVARGFSPCGRCKP